MADSRFNRISNSSDKRTQVQINEMVDKSDAPAPHAESHFSGGYDAIDPSDIGAASVTDFQSHTTAGNPHSDSASDTEFQSVKTEVINARATFSTLDDRLDDFESRISALEGA